MVIAERIKSPVSELRQYNIEFDLDKKDRRFLKLQLETLLKEHFNVLLSQVEYAIVDGHLVSPGKTEPFANSVKRGRDFIQKLSPNPVDIERENAEVKGFEEAIDPFLSDPTTPLGSKILSVSPKGEEDSRYEHNFYDIFTLKEKDGKRYVELSRYSSGLVIGDYGKYIGAYSNFKTAADFLAHPIRITDPSITPEQIHQMLHKEHEYMKPSEFEIIWRSYPVQMFVERYIFKKDADSFNGMLNAADEVWKNNQYAYHIPSSSERWYLEKKPVRQVAGGCPGKSGASNGSNSVFSVSEFSGFGKDRGYSFDREGTCVVCNSGPKALGPCEICEQCTIKIEKDGL